MNQTAKTHGGLFLVGLIYGANYIIAKGVMPDYLSPSAFILFRVTLAFLLFALYHRLTSREKIKNSRDFRYLALCGLFGVAANQLFFFTGLSLGSPVNASIIMTATPIIVLGISAVYLKESLTWRKILGIILGATGAILLITRKQVSFENDFFTGDLFVLANATCYAIYLVLVKPMMKRYEAITVVKWVFFYGMLFVFPFGITHLLKADFTSFPLSIWGSIAFVIIGTTFIAYLINAQALRFVSSTVVGYYIYLQPLFATLIAIAVGMETFHWDKLIYAAFIFTGTYLVSIARR